MTETLLKFRDLVRDMRTEQKEYFKARKIGTPAANHHLKRAKELEAQVDKCIEDLSAITKPNLFS